MTDLENHLLKQLLTQVVDRLGEFRHHLHHIERKVDHMSANSDALGAALDDLKNNVVPSVQAEVDRLKALVGSGGGTGGEDVDAKLPAFTESVSGIADQLKAIVASAQA